MGMQLLRWRTLIVCLSLVFLGLFWYTVRSQLYVFHVVNAYTNNTIVNIIAACIMIPFAVFMNMGIRMLIHFLEKRDIPMGMNSPQPSRDDVKGFHVGRLHRGLASMPLLMITFGGLIVFLWTGTIVTQISTSEYLGMGIIGRITGIEWTVFQQPWLLISGQAPVHAATTWLYAWIIELVTLVFSMFLSTAIKKISIVNMHIAKWVVPVGIVLIGLNSWADYSAAPGATPLMQFLIAVTMGGFAVVGLPLGLGLIEAGVEEY